MYRNFVFTVNNYTDEEYARIRDSKIWSYVILGEEIGEKGTPHIQGYGELVKRTRRETIHKFFNGRAHCENRRGTQEEAIRYCKKEGIFSEVGDKGNQGARGDLDRIRIAAVDDGMREVVRIGNLQQIRVAEKFLEYNEDQRDWKPHVTWLWGATGVGKSRKARELTGDDVYCKNTGTKWWVGYDGHEDIIIDDFRDSWWDITYMLGLIDRYAFQVETKGGQRQMRAKKIIITSAKAPRECYRNCGEAIDQLIRRLDTIEQIVPEVVPEVEGVILGPLENILFI